MQSSPQFLLTIGGILLLGLIASTVARRTLLPRVTILLVLGIMLGEDALDVVPKVFSGYFDIIADITLLMVGFLLGGKLTKATLRKSAVEVFWISISAAVLTTIIVIIGLIFLGVPKEISIVLGCIASATAPAAILDVVNESKTKGKFGAMLLSIVALDDVWGLAMFGLGLALVESLSSVGGGPFFLWSAIYEVGGAVILGVVMGLPSAYLTGRVKKGQPILSEALGLVFVCGGLALWLDVSYLIAAMVMGGVIANLAKHHEYPFHAIEGIEAVFMIIFFFMAGVSLDLGALENIGVIGAGYVVCRMIGKYLGAWVGGQIGGANRSTKKWMGVALLPQAGVAIGMALVASARFPEHRQTLLSIVISSTVLFEIIGPVFTRAAIQRAGRVEQEI